MNNGRENEIRLLDILRLMVKHRLLLIMLTAAGLVVGIVISIVTFALGEVSKEYAITSAIAVTSQTEDGLFTTQRKDPNSTDVHLAEDMVDSVIYVLKSDKLLDAAISRINLVGIPVQNISSHLHLTQYRSTQIVEMVLYWRSAEEGVRILTSINEVAPAILSDTLKIGSVSVVNHPTAKYRVGGNMNLSLWIIMAALGFLCGAGFCAVQAFAFPGLLEPDDLEQFTGVEKLGQIPANAKYFSRRRSPLSDDSRRIGTNVREGYAAASHILLNRLGEGTHRLYVTSTDRGEGKTVAAAQLAAELAGQEKRVLLVDLDICNPTLGNLFLDSVSYEESLNALYRGDAEPAGVVHMLNGYLDLLPAVLEKDPLNLDDAMLRLIQQLGEGYDCTIMDASPAGQLSDILNLNRIADGLIFIARYDHTRLRRIEDTLSRLKRSGSRIVGYIVTDVGILGGAAPGGSGRKPKRRRKEADAEK